MTEATYLQEIVPSEVVMGLDTVFDDDVSSCNNNSATSKNRIEETDIGCTPLMKVLNDNVLPDATTIDKIRMS